MRFLKRFAKEFEIPVVRKYRKTGLDVEAIHFMPTNQDEVANWCGGMLTIVPRESDCTSPDLIIIIKNPNGEMIARLGDYVIKIGDDNYYACDADTFTKTYEEITNGT